VQRLSRVRKTTLLVVAALGVVGCGRVSSAQSVAELRSREPEVRRAAADDLRHIGPPPWTVPRLMDALVVEKDPEAYGALMLALGKAGAPEALPYICRALRSPDSRVAGWADKSLRLLEETNGASCPPAGAPVEAVFPGAPPASASAVVGPRAPPGWQPVSDR